MTHARAKLLGAGLVVILAATLLAVSGVREGWVYFLPVDEFLKDTTHRDQRVRLHGKVAESNVLVDRAAMVASFDLRGNSNSLPVRYSGVIPDMFDAGRDVVVEGRMDTSGVFCADTLMTKCASKYESGDGQAPHADPHLKEAAK